MDPKRLNKRLKSILPKRTRLSPEDAASAYDAATEANKPLSDVLVAEGKLSEKEFISAVSQEINLPPIDVSKVSVDDALLESVPKEVASYYVVLPVSKIGRILTVAVADPFDVLKLDDLKLVTSCEIRPVVSTVSAIREAISVNYDRAAEAMSKFIDDIADPTVDMSMAKTEEDEEDIDMASLTGEGEEGHPIIRLVNMIIYQGIRQKASDIHVEPFEKKLRIRYRVDGKLFETTSPPRKMHASIISRIKIMCGMDIAEKRRPQDGKFQLKIEGRQIDFRVSTLPMVFGEKVVLRILDSSSLTLKLESLGFEDQVLKHIRGAIKAPYGMMLVTGPTGSGKSTTLYSCLKEIMSVEDNITTVEEPVEYQLDGINQVPVNPAQGLTFAGALRSILRQDPDIIMVGEIRDQETIEIAVKAALTGHLVLSTLHTNDAPSTVTRMVDMGVDPFLVSSSTLLVTAQRLCRQLCQECKEPDDPPKERLVEVGLTEEDMAEDFQLYKAVGCPLCSKGYKGRFALVESMWMHENIKRSVVEGGTALDIKKLALENGMISLRRCGLLNAMRGLTTLKEVVDMTMAD